MKRCRVCDRSLPISEFYGQPRSSDGLMYKCKGCHRRAVRENYAAKRSQYHEYERRRYQEPERRQSVSDGCRLHRERHPERYKARSKVGNAIRAGRLVPRPCEVCGGKAQAHHLDHSKPLDVRWLCFQHHREEHGQHPSPNPETPKES